MIFTDKRINRRIVFRSDGNATIGLGHVFRLLSLAEMCKDEFDCLFVIQQSEERITALIKGYCAVHVLTAGNEPQQLRQILRSTDIVVLDGYYFDETYQQLVKTLAGKLVFIDDKATLHFYADLVINHGGEFLKDTYRKEPYTKILAGFRYLMLRKEFLSAALNTKQVAKVDTVYICMGGADPFNITVKAIRACRNCDFINKIIVVSGIAYDNKAALLNLVAETRLVKGIVHEEGISAERMVQLIGESDIAICPASSVAIEVCCVKAGLLTGTVIDNQAGIHQQLVHAGCCISAGDFNTASEEDIATYIEQLSDVDTVNEMIQKQAMAIDGLSMDRILNEFKKLTA